MTTVMPTEWNPPRIRGLMALMQVGPTRLAARLGINYSSVKRWLPDPESGREPRQPSATVRRHLDALERQYTLAEREWLENAMSGHEIAFRDCLQMVAQKLVADGYRELQTDWGDRSKPLVGLRLRKRRKAKGFKTQQALADRLGCSVCTIGRIERGQDPSPLIAAKLREALKR